MTAGAKIARSPALNDVGEVSKLGIVVLDSLHLSQSTGETTTMNKMLQATYRNGTLLLSEKLDPALEGAQIRVMILDTEGNELPANQPIDPSDQTEDEAPRVSRKSILTRLSRRRFARYTSEDEGDREAVH